MSQSIKATQMTMKTFCESIDGDEEMLKFAVDNLDAPDDAIVEIQIQGQLVTFGLVETA